MGFFDKIKESLTRTKEQFVGRFDEAARRADSPNPALLRYGDRNSMAWSRVMHSRSSTPALSGPAWHWAGTAGGQSRGWNSSRCVRR